MKDAFFPTEIATELLNELITIVRRVYFCRQTADSLRHSVETILPIISDLPFSGEPHRKQLSDLLQLLLHALDLARKLSASSRFNVYRTIQLSRKMEKVESDIDRWIKRLVPVYVMADVMNMRVESNVRFDRLERKIEGVGEGKIGFLGMVEREEEVLGFRVRVGKERVRDLLLGNVGGGDLVGICGIGGSGKTTLAREISKDLHIQNYFGERIFFETVSQFPNLETLKLKLWEQISGNMVIGLCKQMPQWQIDLKPRVKHPILIVLDDVWSQTQLEELIFSVPGCKILVVSRFKFPTIINNTYELELLSEDESLSLFCSSAFGHDSIPDTFDKNLVNQVVAECKGLPLALKVIGASMRDQPPKIWVSAKNRLSRGETISDSHEIKLLERMATSIECLGGKVKECFLDLGSFPEDKKIPLDVLINLWMEIHDLDEEDAFAKLVELSNRNLLTLVKDTQKRAGDIYSSYCELSITQHDILRDLALYMNNREPLKCRKRLIMPRREAKLPKDWERNHDQPFDAQIVSIHTGEMKEFDWSHIKCPKAEVLMINFSAETYFLPPFLNTMPNLKSLILINYGSSTAALENTSTFSSINNLHSLWFEKITVPSQPWSAAPLHNLRKISLVLCELKHSIKNFGSTLNLKAIFPNLSHVTIDHCIDLTEFPSSICEMSSLESMSISNCHDLQELPTEFGKLESLQILRVYACPALKNLPQSICRLNKLKYLDISQCINLRDLPDEFGRLANLEKIDMRECLQLREIPRSFASRSSLLHVVCDEDMAAMWKERGRDMPELRVQVVEECFNLDWLVE